MVHGMMVTQGESAKNNAPRVKCSSQWAFHAERDSILSDGNIKQFRENLTERQSGFERFYMGIHAISQREQNEQAAFAIRQLASGDEGRLQRFIGRFSATDRRFFSFLEQREFSQLLDPSSFWTVLCVLQGNEIVGYAHLEKFRQAEKKHVARLGIIVDAAARQRGMGRRLTLELLQQANLMGVEKIWLSVLADNSQAIHLYESVGFRAEGIFIDEERDAIGSRDVVSMSLFLPRRPGTGKASFIPWSRPSIGIPETASVLKVLHSGWLTQGKLTEEFEHQLASYVGAKHVVVFNNGTSALYASYQRSFRPGETVIFPSMTFVSTLNAALASRVEPLLVDCEAKTANPDLNQVETLLRQNPKIKGFVVVDIGGLPCDPRACHELADRFGVTVIEDAAQALGSVARENRVGSFGHQTIFSFHAAKLLTTVEGGAVAVNDDGAASELRKLRSHGESFHQKFVWEDFGLNLRFTDIQAAIGLAQLQKLDGFIAHRTHIAGLYRDSLSDVLEFQEIPAYAGCHPCMLLPAKLRRGERASLVAALEANSIQTRPCWNPLHEQPVFRHLFNQALPASEDWGHRGICLPIFNDIPVNDANRVIEAIHNYFRTH